MDWNLLDPRELKRQNREEKKEAEMKRKSGEMSKSETKEKKPRMSDAQPDETTSGVSSNGKKMGRPLSAWENKSENQSSLKLWRDIDEKLEEVRHEAKVEKRRASDEELSESIMKVLEKNKALDQGNRDKLKAEILRLLGVEIEENEILQDELKSLKRGFPYDSIPFEYNSAKALVKGVQGLKGRGIVSFQGLLQIVNAEIALKAKGDEVIRPELRNYRLIVRCLNGFEESRYRQSRRTMDSQEIEDIDDGLEVEEDGDVGVMPSTTENNKASSSSSAGVCAGYNKSLKPSSSAEASTDKMLTGLANYGGKYVSQFEKLNDYEEDD